MKRNKVAILPQVNTCGGDLEKKWFVYFSYKDPRNGEMKRFKIYEGLHKIKEFKKRQAAAEKLCADLTEKIRNGWNPFLDDEKSVYEDQLQYNAIARVYGKRRASNKTVRYYSSLFLNDAIKEAILEPETLRTYTSKLRTFDLWLESRDLHGDDISCISNQVVIDFFRFMIDERKLSGNSIKKYRQILRNMFEFARKQKALVNNPVYDIPDCRRVNDQSPRPIAEFDITAFKDVIHAEDPQLWLAICFEYYCFLRPGKELRFLQVKDIDFTRGTINVDRERAKTNLERFPTIPLVFLEELRAMNIHRFPKHYYVIGSKGEPGTESLSKNTLRNRFRHFREKLNMPDSYKFYSWKHTGNGRASDAGITTKDLQGQNGHTSILTTEKYMRFKIGQVNTEIRDHFPKI
jgi:integrase